MSCRVARAFGAIIVMAVVMTAGCSGDSDAVVTAAPPGDDVVVPDLVGLGPEDATATLCAAGLSVGEVSVVARTPPVRAGPEAALAASGIRSTRPGAGASVAAGRPIDLRIVVPGDAAVLVRKAC